MFNNLLRQVAAVPQHTERCSGPHGMVCQGRMAIDKLPPPSPDSLFDSDSDAIVQTI